ncbi:hypothetical protein FSP39_015177 [Pinctada imbricata]|uniref:DNA-directed RNA polymerase n=1 Tax=Pinctada imbricata TaxID=66713 RepID=A0AA88YGE6_PINIB|nr:hypothetical protein FSP39_015177 [Pinctada imbricata]
MSTSPIAKPQSFLVVIMYRDEHLSQIAKPQSVLVVIMCGDDHQSNRYGRRHWVSRSYTSKLGKEIPYFYKPKVNQRRKNRNLQRQKKKAFNELSKGLEIYHQKLLEGKDPPIQNPGRLLSAAQEGVTHNSPSTSLDIDLSTAEQTNRVPVILDHNAFTEMISDKTFAKKLKQGFRLVSSVDSNGNKKNLTNKPSSIFLVEDEPHLIYTRTYDFDLSNDWVREKRRKDNSESESVINSLKERVKKDVNSESVINSLNKEDKSEAKCDSDISTHSENMEVLKHDTRNNGESVMLTRRTDEFSDYIEDIKVNSSVIEIDNAEVGAVGSTIQDADLIEHGTKSKLKGRSKVPMEKFSPATHGFGWINSKEDEMMEREEMMEKQEIDAMIGKKKGKKKQIDIMLAKNKGKMVERSRKDRVVGQVRKDITEEMILTDKQIEASQKRFNQDYLSFIQAHIAINQENVAMMGEVWQYMEAHNVKPNVQSFAGSLECLGRKNLPSKTPVQKLLKRMEEMGYEIDDILKDSVLVKDEEKFVIKAITQAIPTYKPKRDKKNVCYHGNQSPEQCPPLVQKLYQDSDLKVKNPYAHVMNSKNLMKAVQTQISREKGQYVKVKSVISSDKDMDFVEKNREKLNDLLNTWKVVLTGRLGSTIVSLERTQNASYGISLYPFLKILRPDELTHIMMEETEKYLGTSEFYSPPIRQLHTNLGRSVYNKVVNKQRAKDHTLEMVSAVYKEFVKECNKTDFTHSTHLELWESICLKKYGRPSIRERKIDWSNYLQQKIGRLLMDLILTNCTVDMWMFNPRKEETKMAPAFYKVFRFHGDMGYIAELKASPVLTKLMRYCQMDQLTFNTEDIPMVSPPLPWTSKDSGGNILLHTDLIRAKFSVDTQSDFLTTVPDHRYFASLDALNKVACCPWRLNTEMLDIMIDIFRNHGNDALGITPDVSTIPKVPEKKKNMTPKEKKELYKRQQEIKKMKAETYSLWCTDLYRLSIANMLRDEVFWFPHNMDFRSRIYPTSTYLNQQNEDMVRGLLRFANGKPLGENGLDWLKIHLVNLTGLKKRVTNAERLEFANEKMDEILDSAKNPLTGRLWWQSADEPWQTLAVCKEIAKAVESPDPTKFMSYLPTHQDGSCNGLQHYAAMGRDQSGAESVNLCPIEKPMDVYSDVMELVEETRQRDAEKGIEIAKILEGFVKRKVIKQTIMTTVYGVTFYGGKLQILRQLKDIPDFPQEHAKDASVYLAENTFKNLQKRFTATKEIQDWFTIISYMLSRYCQEPMTWTTPLNMPILQPYFSKKVPTQSFPNDQFLLNSMPQLGRRNADTPEISHPLKQKNGFPPNFVHSLDSSHMMLTALYCWRAGIGFTSIHDCFWTHACDVDTMNKICREQFVALHSQPILENLSEELLDILDREHPDLHMKKVSKANMIASIIRSVPRRGVY